MQLKKRLKAIFMKPEKKIVALLPEFQQLRQILQNLSKSGDPLTNIVYFFNAVSKWHDRGIDDLIAAFEQVNYGQYDEVLEKLRTLQAHFINAGREHYGWNQTKRGETVTADRVFLGNIYGLSTKSVSFWKQRKDEKKDDWGYPGMEDFNAYDVVSSQALGFMTSHVAPMISVIRYLENIVR